MSTPSLYTLHHPKWFRRRVSVFWWLQKRSYTVFVLRELTSVFVALFAVLTLWQIRSVSAGEEAHARLMTRLGTPGFVVLHVVALAFLLFHSITWFNLAPKAMAVRIRGKRVPDLVVAGSNYVAWLVLSAAVAFIVLGR
jgi:fumarate reductase subunit C